MSIPGLTGATTAMWARETPGNSETNAGAAAERLRAFATEFDRRFAKYLTPEFHVIALDVPGFAESSKIKEQSYNMASQTLRLDKFVAALKE